MWLMTRHGFFSIVDKGTETHIRARERGDLERLSALAFKARGGDAQMQTIVETPTADYRFRLILTGPKWQRQATVGAVMDALGKDIDYPNFKAEIDQRPDQARKPYHEVWGVIARALGAYGRKGAAWAGTRVDPSREASISTDER